MGEQPQVGFHSYTQQQVLQGNNREGGKEGEHEEDEEEEDEDDLPPSPSFMASPSTYLIDDKVLHMRPVDSPVDYTRASSSKGNKAKKKKGSNRKEERKEESKERRRKEQQQKPLDPDIEPQVPSYDFETIQSFLDRDDLFEGFSYEEGRDVWREEGEVN